MQKAGGKKAGGQKAGGRVKVFVFGLVAATAAMPFVFGAIFREPAETNPLASDEQCFQAGLTAFEEAYGDALSAEIVGIEGACEKGGTLTSADLKELRGLP